MPVARLALWELVHELKKQGYGVYLLSNYSEELFKKHTEYADFMNDIDGLIVSCLLYTSQTLSRAEIHGLMWYPVM